MDIYGGLPPQQMHAWEEEILEDTKALKPKKADTDEESMKRIIKLATQNEMNQLWHPHLTRNGMSIETDFTHMDGPLSGPMETPDKEELREPPGFDYVNLLQEAINHGDESRKQFAQPASLEQYGPYAQPRRFAGSAPQPPASRGRPQGRHLKQEAVQPPASAPWPPKPPAPAVKKEPVPDPFAHTKPEPAKHDPTGLTGRLPPKTKQLLRNGTIHLYRDGH